MAADGFELLGVALWLRTVRLGSDAAYAATCDALEAFHGDRRSADRIVTRQAQTAALLGAGYSPDEVGVIMGVDRRTVRRDVGVIGRVLGVGNARGRVAA